MPGKLRQLSGREVQRILGGFGFEVLSQRGSHLKLRRLGPTGQKQTLIIPAHDVLRSGTLRAIFRQALDYLPEAELRRHFFAD